MNLAAVDWGHFSAHMARAAGRLPIVCLLVASFGMGYFALVASDPGAAEQLAESWVLVTLAGREIDAVEVTFLLAGCWVSIPFVEAFEAFLPLREVLDR